MQADMNAVLLPDGTRIGRVKERAGAPDTFDGWLESDTGADHLVVSGADRNLAVLEVVRTYLVREIKIQQQTTGLEPEYAKRTGRIMHGFHMQRDLTLRHLGFIHRDPNSSRTS